MFTARKVFALFLVVALFWTVVRVLGPARVERGLNTVIPHEPYVISEEGRAMHERLLVADLHADSSLWNRDLLERSDYGHVDIPRMLEGNIYLQVFTSVTESPRGQNYERNAAGGGDNITLLAAIQGWPISTLVSNTDRAAHQIRQMRELANRAPHTLEIITSGPQLRAVINQRRQGAQLIAAVLGTEGGHAIDGSLKTLHRFYGDGLRVMGLQHFFDNELGGSLHGVSGEGLTEFGREVVRTMDRLDMIIDLAHSSEQVVHDVLEMGVRGVIVSHTGFKGHCDTPRNLSDETLLAIAKADGLIGVGFWDAAVCDPSPAGIVSAIRYGIELVGARHIALGSDFDGTIAAPFDVSEMSVLTDEMLRQGLPEDHIFQVMGTNAIAHFERYLPRK